MKRMRITCRDRLKLPDSAFAYIDPKTGNRLLPIMDITHARAAIHAVMSWKDGDPAKRIAMKKIEKEVIKFGIAITSGRWKIPEEPWSVS